MVADDEDLGIRACFDQGIGGIVFTVGAREDRDQRFRPCTAEFRFQEGRLFLIGSDRTDLFIRAFRLGRIDFFKNSVVELFRFLQGDRFIRENDRFFFGRIAKRFT